MGLLRTELEKVKEEKEGFEFKIAKFEKSLKDLDQLLASQITDKSKKGFGYNVVPSPHPLILNRPTNFRLIIIQVLQEFKEPEGLSDDEDDDEGLSLRLKMKMLYLLLLRYRAIHIYNERTGLVDSGCSRHMTGNIAHLSDFKDFDGGYVTFGERSFGELKFNLFSVSQMCDKKNYVLFTDSECLVLSPNFKLPDENQILLKIPRQDNMYSFDMKNIVPKDSLTCLVAKATSEESMLG
ncbi:hypothetical protein Tco_0025432 [Tanacetum coccineum]